MKKRTFIGLFLMTLSILLGCIFYFNTLSSGKKSDVEYELYDYNYRVLSVNLLEGIAEYSVFCYLENTNKISDMQLMEFILMLDSAVVLDTFYKMQYMIQSGIEVFGHQSKYNIHFCNENVIDETYLHEPTRNVFVDRRESSICFNFKGRSHVRPDTCVHAIVQF